MNITRNCVNLLKVPRATGLFKRPTNVRSITSINRNRRQKDVHQKEHQCLKLPQARNIFSKSIEAEDKPPLLNRIVNKIPFINVHKTRLGVTGYMLYESIADKINYAEFFEEFSLPDTFYSWFCVTELHIWMLAVRAMAEGDDGRYVRNKMIEAMWADVGLRAKKLGAINPAATRMQVHELAEQFQAALIAYDEGLQSDDTVLAGALWRRMYQQREVDPEHLDGLIKYIRRQTRLLDSVARSELFVTKPFNWSSLGAKK